MAVRLGQELDAFVQPAVVDDDVAGVAGGVEHLQVRSPPHRLRGELAAVAASRQDDVGEEDGDVVGAVENGEGRIAVGGRTRAVTQPLDELAARLRALLRRRPVASAPATLAGPDGLALDPAELCAWRGGERIPLSRREFAILRALVEHPRAILSKTQLEDRLYGFNEGVGSNAVEVHVHHLRGKLGADAVETVRGVGYRLGRKDGR